MDGVISKSSFRSFFSFRYYGKDTRLDPIFGLPHWYKNAIVLTALFVFTCPLQARAEIEEIWALDDGTKIKADDFSNKLARGNNVFTETPPAVRLFGARNEIVAFQVIIKGGRQETHQVSVSLDSVGTITNAGTSNDPDRYFIGRRIEIFKQHYFNITRRSATLTWEPFSPAAPRDMGGLVPDALIPLSLEKTFIVPAHKNQGIWVDIFIPKGVEPRIHRGSLRINVNGTPCALPACKMVIELDVLPQTLPDKPTTKTMLWFSGSDKERDCMPSRYFKDPFHVPEDKLEALRERHFKLGRRHRISMFMGQDKKPTESLLRRISGQAFSQDAGYEGPGEGVGQDIYPIQYAGGELNSEEARVWTDWFAKHSPHATYFLYTFDEPGPDRFAEVNRRARAARPVPSFTTAHPQPGLEVDIYCSGTDYYSPKMARSVVAKGKQVWVYNGCRPFSGTFLTDDTAISTRVNPYIQYKFNIPVWFYWESTYYKDFQGYRVQPQVNVWQEPMNFTNKNGDKLMGDGLLLYPGRDVFYPDEDRDFDGPLPSIRLKNWRRGIQDVEYLVLAKKAGHELFVNKLLQILIPKATIDETEHGAPVSWSEDGEKWFKAREALAMLLKNGQPPAWDLDELAEPSESLFGWSKRKIKRIFKWSSKKRFMVAGSAVLLLLAGTFLGVYWLRCKKKKRNT